MQVVRTRLQENFGRAAAHYDARAQFQHKETLRVLDAAQMLFPAMARVVDIGCGTGYFAHAVREKQLNWDVMGVDIAEGMCRIASDRCTVMVGDAAYLPLTAGSVDAAVSSLCYQWVENQAQAFAELARVLKPGGCAVLASLGKTTLAELRDCAQQAALPLGLLPMRDFDETKYTLEQSGLLVTFAEKRQVTEYYAHVPALLDSMRHIGAGNNFANSPRGLLAPKRWAAMLAAYEKCRTAYGIPATWEHHFFILHKPV